MNVVPGLFLGTVGQTCYLGALRPMHRWVQRNTGETAGAAGAADMITPRARDAIVCLGSVVAWVLPALLTSLLLPKIAGHLLPRLPDRISFNPSHFDWRWATLANVAPLAVHAFVELSHQEKLDGKRKR